MNSSTVFNKQDNEVFFYRISIPKPSYPLIKVNTINATKCLHQTSTSTSMLKLIKKSIGPIKIPSVNLLQNVSITTYKSFVKPNLDYIVSLCVKINNENIKIK